MTLVEIQISQDDYRMLAARALGAGVDVPTWIGKLARRDIDEATTNTPHIISPAAHPELTATTSGSADSGHTPSADANRDGQRSQPDGSDESALPSEPHASDQPLLASIVFVTQDYGDDDYVKYGDLVELLGLVKNGEDKRAPARNLSAQLKDESNLHGEKLKGGGTGLRVGDVRAAHQATPTRNQP